MHEPAWPDLTPYLKASSRLMENRGNDLLGNAVTIGTIQTQLQVSATTKTAVSTIADDAFWGPYS